MRQLVSLAPPLAPLGLPIASFLLDLSTGLLDSPSVGDLFVHIPNTNHPQLDSVVDWTENACIVAFGILTILHSGMDLLFVLAFLYSDYHWLQIG